MATADFWNNPDAPGGKPVVRHAPSDGQYHFPDWEMMGKMPGSKVGAFAVVPEANKNGLSKGFDGTKAGVVHVDPDCPDGGAVIDVSQIDEQSMDEAIATSNYPHEAFYKLGAAPQLAAARPVAQYEMPEQPRVNPIMPGAYVVPKAAENGTQRRGGAPKLHASMQMPIMQSPPGQTPMSQPQESYVATPQYPQSLGPAPTLPGGVYPQAPQMQQNTQPMMPPPQMPYPGYGYPPPPDPNIAALTQMVAHLSQQVQAVTQAPPQQPQQSRLPALSTMPVGMSANSSRAEQRRAERSRIRTRADEELRGDDEDMEDQYDEGFFPPVLRNQEQQPLPTSKKPRGVLGRNKKAQSLDEYEEQGRRPTRVIAGFETLEIEFITGPMPEKPRSKVFFEFPRGKQSAMFHGVVINEALVALIYDTRYEGSQFVPQELGDEPIHLHIGEEVYRVNSMGLTFQMGVLDVVVLVRNDNTDE